MDNDVLNSLLREYDQKRIRAELDLEKRKEALYKSIPELQEIENEINSYSINNAKNILNNIKSNNYASKIEKLKNEKKRILQENNLYIKLFQNYKKLKQRYILIQ